MLLLGMGTALMAGCRAVPEQPLSAAAFGDDTDAVRRLLDEGLAPDDLDDHGLTPLMWAARAGATGAMRLLLDAGASANGRDTNNRWTPLLHAVHKQRPDAVRVLLERGADPNLAAPNGVTPLLLAADDLDPTAVRLLLEHGADPHTEGPGGATALTRAVSGGALTDLTDRPLFGGCRPDTVRALLAHDPSLRVPDTGAGRRALWWANIRDCAEVLNLVGAAHHSVGHEIVSASGALREELGLRIRKDAPGGTRATDDPSRR